MTHYELRQSYKTIHTSCHWSGLGSLSRPSPLGVFKTLLKAIACPCQNNTTLVLMWSLNRLQIFRSHECFAETDLQIVLLRQEPVWVCNTNIQYPLTLCNVTPTTLQQRLWGAWLAVSSALLPLRHQFDSIFFLNACVTMFTGLHCHNRNSHWESETMQWEWERTQYKMLAATGIWSLAGLPPSLLF